MDDRAKELLKTPVRPFEVGEDDSVLDVIEKLGGVSFQGRNLSRALDVWMQMLDDETTIFLGLAGAMVPAGMRKVIVFLIKNRLIDCLVSTGANLFHDVHEERGKRHWKGDQHVNDVELLESGVDRIYDVYASEKEFLDSDALIARFAGGIDKGRPYTTREFLYLLGGYLAANFDEEGILSAAHKANVPIYCPAIGDSSIGIAVASMPDGRDVRPPTEEGSEILFDVIADLRETAKIATEAKSSSVIYIGGGTPKNFIQQTAVTAFFPPDCVRGHKYAVQIITDPPHWGGLSGCTFDEAQSWGKIDKEAQQATVYCDATIALPFLVSALAQQIHVERIARPSMPRFRLDGRLLEIES